MAHDPSWETFSPQLASVTKSLMNEMLNTGTVVSRVGGRTTFRTKTRRSRLFTYIRLELDDSNVVTWSTAASLSFTVAPRIRRLDTRSTSGCSGGGARMRLAVITISFVLSRLSLSAAHTFADAEFPLGTCPC